MNRAKHLIAMANAIDKVLPCDKYASAEEWMARNAERLRDVGYTRAEADELVAEARRDIDTRAEARATLAGIISRKCRIPSGASPEQKKEAQDFVVLRLKTTGHFVGINPGTNFARYARHIKYFSKKSARIKLIYGQLFDVIREMSAPYLLRCIAGSTPAAVDTFAAAFDHRYWRLNDADAYAFYGANQFSTCKRTKLKAPTARMLSVIIDDDGRTERMHPKLATDPRIQRDAISGQLIWKDAVDWVELDSGEPVWRRYNEARGTIFFEDGIWQRGNTNGRVAGYHSADRRWRSRPKTSYRRHIGVELECGFKSQEAYQRFTSRFVLPDGRFVSERPFLIENDSSLSRVRCGVEIISEPLELYEGYQAPDSHWRWLLDKLVRGAAEGWKHRQYAGIHVNMDVSDRSPADILRYAIFVHNAAAISQFVSGRKYIYGCAPDDGEQSPPTNNELVDLDKFTSEHKKIYSGGYERIDQARFKTIGRGDAFNTDALAAFRSRGKYQPVHIRGNSPVLETRIFGSNIRYEGFMACVEYCVGGMEFTTQLANDSDIFHPELSAQFRAWLSDNREKYPNLASRIGVIQSSAKPTVVARPLAELTA